VLGVADRVALFAGSVRDVIVRARAAWRPPPKLTLSQWADQHFYLSPESSAQAGRWSTLPYQKEIMDSISDVRVTEVTLMKSARVGYTKILDAALGYFIDQDPSSSLVVQPTLEDAKGFSKEEIGTMMRDCPRLRGKVVDVEEDTSTRASGTANTMLHKRYAGGVLSIVGANSGAGFRRISRRFIACDEIDAYPASAGADGDPVKLAQRRSEFFWNRKLLNGSTPLIEGFSRIERKFLEGDQRRYFVPCPQCGHFDHLVFQSKGEAHGAGDGHYMKWPKGQPEAAFFVCSKNGCVIEHAQKFEMVRRGHWRPTRPEKDGPAPASVRSFHIWAAYSFSPNATWGQIAKEWHDAATSKDLEVLKTVVNTVLGQTWKESGEAPEWERLFQRRELYAAGVVPAGVKFLTMGVDVQKDRLIYEVVGWGLNRESWSIDIGVLMGDTAKEATWLQLDDFLERVFPREGAPPDAPGLKILRLCVDTGYNTQNVYNWVRQKDQSRVSAVKGSSEGGDGLIGAPKSVDVNYNGKRFARGVKLWAVGGAVAKGELYAWLRIQPPIPEEGKPLEPFPPGYCHFPQHDGEFFKQLTAERLTAVKHPKTGQETREWHVLPGRENHWLDCRVYARAAAAMLGLDRVTPPRRERSAPAVAAPVAAPPAPRPPRKPSDYKLRGFLNRGNSYWKR
jgi:phage terminase large subunit GpA-like protein